MRSFRSDNLYNLERNQIAQFAAVAASQWLSLRLQMMGVALVTGVALIAIVEHSHQAVNASKPILFY